MKPSFELRPPAIFCGLNQRGVSSEADLLRQRWSGVYTTLATSVALGSQLQYLQMSLAGLAKDAAVSNWDGHGASPVDPDSLKYARRVSHFLPLTYPAPDVAVDPDGEVTFDWQHGRTRYLSFSVSPIGTLQYASIIGSSEMFGKEPWRDGIPEPIAVQLQKVVSFEPAE